jgi:protein-S-isoprenylcysteine O-methyltransferase Ste14
MKKKDGPGVYLPPPLLYVLIFLFSVLVQKKFPLPMAFFSTNISFVAGVIFVIAGLCIVLPALIRFLRTKNTLIPFLPANSLQTTGIYSVSRNPMYLGLLILYIGVGFLKGNFYTMILIPLVIIVLNYLVIIKEEKYLIRTFGNDFLKYLKNVRRWI